MKNSTAEKTWRAVIKHCRWIGIPISYSRATVAILNGKKIQVLASTNIITDWQKSFKGAWKIAIYFKKSDKITWQRVSTLLHEMGHVFDYRENMIIDNRGIIQTERIANNYAIKIAKVLELPIGKIKPHLSKIIEEYTAVLGKNKTAKMELLWRDFNATNPQQVRAGRSI